MSRLYGYSLDRKDKQGFVEPARHPAHVLWAAGGLASKETSIAIQ